MASKKETKQLSKMASELNTIKQKMSSLNTGPSPKSKAGSKKRKGVPQPFSTSTVGNSRDSASVSVTRTEMLLEIKTTTAVASGALIIKPTQDVLPWLQKLAACYSQIEWHSLAIFWKPAVSATTNGRIIYSVDVDGAATDPKSRPDVAAHFPCLDIQIWQDNEARPLNVPRDLLTSRKRFLLSAKEESNSSPGAVLYYASGPANSVLGELWVRYSVRMLGPR